jgi:hypothetical protein
VTSRPKKIQKDMIAAMRAAGIRPELIYAYERTGFLLSEDGYKSLSAEDKAEYDAAIDEYFAQTRKE